MQIRNLKLLQAISFDFIEVHENQCDYFAVVLFMFFVISLQVTNLLNFI